jgi:hypothetical protein
MQRRCKRNVLNVTHGYVFMGTVGGYIIGRESVVSKMKLSFGSLIIVLRNNM